VTESAGAREMTSVVESEVTPRRVAPAAPAPPSAWLEEVFRANAGFVANTLRRFGVPAADVGDQLQEVFLVVHRLQETYDAARPLRPWLFGITYRVAARFRQARARAAPTENVDDGIFADRAPLADAALETKEAQSLVLAALERVELSRRAVFLLADLEGEPVTAIADALQIPLNTAYSRLRLAREEFTRAVTLLRRQQGAST
jgi:RNA polymerase sigma-70 factor, ECF subfamily